MEALKKHFDFSHLSQWCHSEKKRYLISLVAVAVMLAITWLLCGIQFETSDDSSIMYIIAGYFSGTPSAIPLFTNYVFGVIISFLYTICPYLPWYTIAHIALIYVSLVVILKSVLKIIARNRSNALVAIVFFAVFYILFCFRPVVLIQFTTTPALAGSAAIFLLLTIDNTQGKKSLLADFSICVLLLLMAYIFRSSSGLITLVYFLLSFAYITIKAFVIFKNGHYKNAIKRVFASCLCAAVAVGAIVGVQAVHIQMANSGGWPQFMEYHSERVAYMDYPHPIYEENPALYEEAGWNASLYSMVNSWYFFDERVDTDFFASINRHTDLYYASISLQTRIDFAASTFQTNVLNNTNALIFLAGIICFFAAALILLLKNKNRPNRKLSIFFLAGVFVAAVGSLAFLSTANRMPIRIILAALLPCASIFLFFICESAAERPDAAADNRKSFELWTLASLLLAITISTVAIPYVSPTFWGERTQEIRFRLAMEEYAIKHPGNIYIPERAYMSDAFVVYPDRKPSNIFFAVGSMMHSPVYEDKLEANRVDTLYSSQLTDDNVFFVSASPVFPQPFLVFLEENYGIHEFRVVDHQQINEYESFTVYKLYPTGTFGGSFASWEQSLLDAAG